LLEIHRSALHVDMPVVRVEKTGSDVDPAVMARAVYGAGSAADFAPLTNLTFRMTRTESWHWFQLLLLATSYLEWGSGGSTVVAAWRSLSTPLTVHSIDSSQAWFDHLKASHPVLGRAQAAGALMLTRADVGKTAGWGHPVQWQQRSASLQLQQSSAYVEAVTASSCCFDLILVDGRFRIACMLHALRLSHSNTTILIHDAQRYFKGAPTGFREVRATQTLVSRCPHYPVCSCPRAAVLSIGVQA
jgi:hypothetical protein